MTTAIANATFDLQPLKLSAQEITIVDDHAGRVGILHRSRVPGIELHECPGTSPFILDPAPVYDAWRRQWNGTYDIAKVIADTTARQERIDREQRAEQERLAAFIAREREQEKARVRFLPQTLAARIDELEARIIDLEKRNLLALENRNEH